MSVRMAIVKLSAVVAGGALIGGGAVHMAEKVAAGKAHYVKHAKAPAHHLAKKATARAKATEVAAASCQTVNCLPHEDLAVVPMPAPNLPPQAEPAPPAAETDGYQEFGGPHGGGPQGRGERERVGGNNTGLAAWCRVRLAGRRAGQLCLHKSWPKQSPLYLSFPLLRRLELIWSATVLQASAALRRRTGRRRKGEPMAPHTQNGGGGWGGAGEEKTEQWRANTLTRARRGPRPPTGRPPGASTRAPRSWA